MNGELQGCRIAGLQDCRIAGLQDCRKEDQKERAKGQNERRK
jgi:hypothetical protein